MLGRVAKFGPFEFHLESGKLLKHGVAVSLQNQSCLVLKLLVENPGQLVTRDRLIKAIWQGVNVDFENGLNTTVARLRQTLGTEYGRKIRAEPKQGYLFDTPVIFDFDPAEHRSNGVSQFVSSEIAAEMGASSPDAKRHELPERVWKGGFYAGEGGICAAISLSYGIMVALALPAEVAYRWPEFRDWAILVSVGVGIGSAVLAGISLRMLRRVRVTARHFDARAIAPAGVLSLWTVMLALAVAPWLPNESIVQATWQTLTAKVGFAKSLLEALGLPLLSLVPVQAVFALREMIVLGDIAPVRNVLSRRSSLAMVGGNLVPGPIFSVAAYAVVTLWWLNTQAHLLENLKIAPYYPLFVELASARASAGLIALLVVVLWYVLRWHQLVSSVQSSSIT